MEVEITRNWRRFHGGHVEALGKNLASRAVQNHDEVHTKLLEDSRREFGLYALGICPAEVGVRLILVRELVGRMLQGVDFVQEGARRASEVLRREIGFQA